MAYRVIITGAAPTDKGRVRLSCSVERLEGDTWVTVEGAPDHLDVDTATVDAILRREISDAEKRAALLDLIRRQARSLPQVVAVHAIARVEDLLPGGWPVAVEL